AHGRRERHPDDRHALRVRPDGPVLEPPPQRRGAEAPGHRPCLAALHLLEEQHVGPHLPRVPDDDAGVGPLAALQVPGHHRERHGRRRYRPPCLRSLPWGATWAPGCAGIWWRTWWDVATCGTSGPPRPSPPWPGST